MATSRDDVKNEGKRRWSWERIFILELGDLKLVIYNILTLVKTNMNKNNQRQQSIDFQDLWENWPYYVYNITPKNDPNQFNELAQLQEFSTE